MIYSPEYTQYVVPVYPTVICGIPQNVTPVTSDSGLQCFDTMPSTENELLRLENDELRAKLARLTGENEGLRTRLDDKYISTDCHEGSKLIRSVEWFARVADFWTCLDVGKAQGLPHTLGFPLSPVLMARIDGALRLGRDGCDFSLLFGGFFRDKEQDEALMDYVLNTNLVGFLTDFYTERYSIIEDVTVRNEIVTMLVGMHLNAETNCNIKPGDMINAQQRRCNHDVSVCTDSIFIDEVIPPFNFDTKDDHIYDKNQISAEALTMIHGLSHLDMRLTGCDIAKYHVGKACRISECSILETVVNGESKYYSPIKCSGEYVICERLPNEVNGRVSVILRNCGMTPLTLVRVIDEKDDSDMYLITDSVGPSLTATMQNYSLCNARVYFNDSGLCVKASGFLNVVVGIDCCSGAFKVTNLNNRNHKQIHSHEQSNERKYNRHRHDRRFRRN